MGANESKTHHRYRSNKCMRSKHDRPVVQKCSHQKRDMPTIVIGHPSLPATKINSETIVPLVQSSPISPSLRGSILNHSFPMHRSISEVQLNPTEQQLPTEISGSLDQFHDEIYDRPECVYDYRKHMQRVDEENRPVLEGLCPDKMYVSTSDLRLCDTQRLPPPLRCKMTQGFFRSIPPPQAHGRRLAQNASFL